VKTLVILLSAYLVLGAAWIVWRATIERAMKADLAELIGHSIGFLVFVAAWPVAAVNRLKFDRSRKEREDRYVGEIGAILDRQGLLGDRGLYDEPNLAAVAPVVMSYLTEDDADFGLFSDVGQP
jgi:hypothetical protein